MKLIGWILDRISRFARAYPHTSAWLPILVIMPIAVGIGIGIDALNVPSWVIWPPIGLYFLSLLIRDIREDRRERRG